MDIERANEYRNGGVSVIIPINNITDIPPGIDFHGWIYKTDKEYDMIIARYPDRTIYVTKFYVLVEEK